MQKKKAKAEIKQLKKKKDVSLNMGDVVTKANAILQQQKLYTTYTKGKRHIWNEERCDGFHMETYLEV
eukprot:CCRYP_015050-RA/>CCRYP_015050-RA protein AED:0.44 eAED:0.44 QI:0/0/0/1/1/1/2/0/67